MANTAAAFNIDVTLDWTKELVLKMLMELVFQ